MSRIISFLIMLPFLVGAWGFANSTGITDRIEDAAGVEIPQGFTIPGADKILDLSEGVRDVRNKAEEKARRALLAEVKDQVRDRYGAEAADAIPEDVPITRLRHLRPDDFASLAALGSALGAPALEALGENVPDIPSGPGNGGQGGGQGGGDGKPPASDSDYMKAILGTAADYNAARETLKTIPVKGRAPTTGYSREFFGDEWDDDAGNFFYSSNGCDTRNDLLKRDLIKVKYDSGSSCEVASGVMRYERYTGKTNVRFDAHDDDFATDFDIEHLVPLSWSFQHGAQKWSEEKRAAFANDPALFAADPSLNRQKSDSGPGAWLPPNKAYRCMYVSEWVRVLGKYGLWINTGDKDAIVRVLDGCPS